MKTTALLIFSVISIRFSRCGANDFRPCNEISREFKFPCKCLVEELINGNPKIKVSCDNVIFPENHPGLPSGAPITAFSQRNVGYDQLPASVFLSSQMPLRSLDLSSNQIRKLSDGTPILAAFKTTLIELNLRDNLLGDALNPIFSTTEFRGLSKLEFLDLSDNKIREIEHGILQGCDDLKVLNLDRNLLKTVPENVAPISTKILSLRGNQIKIDAAMKPQNLEVEQLYLDDNLISSIDSRFFQNFPKLLRLSMKKNKLKTFNSDTFEAVRRLEHLDVSKNFIEKIPTVALSSISSLKTLNLSANLIQTLFQSDLTPFSMLEILDLSRNNIANVGPGTFLGLSKLRQIDLSVNSLRTVEDDAFEGLNDLEVLNLKDNNILLIPASALMRLNGLKVLRIDFNRISALSSQILRSVAQPEITELNIAKNLIRDIPPASFQYFKRLSQLDLSRNSIVSLSPTEAFLGLENTLSTLDLSQNKIDTLLSSFAPLSKLRYLDLSGNSLKSLAELKLPFTLTHLNLSGNPLGGNHLRMFGKMGSLEVLDLSRAQLSVVPEFSPTLSRIRVINLSSNLFAEVPQGAFVNLRNLTEIDLSGNRIKFIHQAAFVNLSKIKILNLSFNFLSRFSGEMFNTGTGLEKLDVSHNYLSYLHPTSFRIHPRLSQISVENNRISSFDNELIATLQYLEELNLSHNLLNAVGSLNFAGLPRLNSLDLGSNSIEQIEEMAFHNTTQLQNLNLQNNKLERIAEGTFDGPIKLIWLNLRCNLLRNIPIIQCEFLDLSSNLLEDIPIGLSPDSLDLSHNLIHKFEADLVQIKSLNLGFNPLESETIFKILTEPKTVRKLNLAGVGINFENNSNSHGVVRLETPFLTHFNVTKNNLTRFPSEFFTRATLLETLDVSDNKFQNLNDLNLSPLTELKSLNISKNDFPMITLSDVENFKFKSTLRVLDLSGLPSCVRLEKSALNAFQNLKILNAFNYPRLGYFDIDGVLKNLELLEDVNFEVKDSGVGTQNSMNGIHVSRIENFGVFGERVQTISPGIFTNFKSKHVRIKLWNTSISELPSALLFGVPRSTKISLNVAGNKIKWLSSQFLSTIDDRKGTFDLIGLSANPIECDCNARALRRWMPEVRCAIPHEFSGKKIGEVGDDELSCEHRKTTKIPSTTLIEHGTTSSSSASFTKPTTTPTTNTKFIEKNTESDIIWSTSSTNLKTKNNIQRRPQSFLTLNNEDTLVVSIVGGTVAFIIILMIIICIIRLKISSRRYRGPGNVGQFPLEFPVGAGVAPASNCGCGSVKNGTIYGYNCATLPYNRAVAPASLHPGAQAPPGAMYTNYSTLSGGKMGGVGYAHSNFDENFR